MKQDAPTHRTGGGDLIKINEVNRDHYSIGPLNIDRRMGKATTVMGAELELTGQEVEALLTLATNEGKPINFETLYNKLWCNKDGCNRTEALQAIINIQSQVEKTGKGFMWIEHGSNERITFHTRWGHNWKTQSPKSPQTGIIPLQAKQKYTRRDRGTFIRGVTSVVSLVAVTALVLIFSPILRSPNEITDPVDAIEIFYLIDDPVPLGPMPFITSPYYGKCEYCEYCEYCEEEKDYCACDP